MAKPITDFARKLRALKIKNRDLAKWMRVTEETVCRWCRGERPVPVALEALIDVLHSKPGMAERHIKGLRSDDWSAPVVFERQTSKQASADKRKRERQRQFMRDWEQGVVAERYIVPSGAALPRELRKEAITQEKRAEQERQTERAVDAWLEG